MLVKFAGRVVLGDDYRVAEDPDELHGSVHIGGQDVVATLDETKFDGPVTVAIADERFTGDLAVELGYGYSEWTPEEPDRLTVGPHNIIKALQRLEDRDVTVWVADEPINVLA